MRNWRAVHGQSIPKTLCEIWQPNTINPATLPINLYAVDPPDVQPLDFTKLGDQHSVQHMPQKEVTEFLYTSNQLVCVKDDKSGCWNHLGTSLPTGEGYSWHERKRWPIFCSRSEDPEKCMYIEEGSIICILTSYKHNQGVLELKE